MKTTSRLPDPVPPEVPQDSVLGPEALPTVDYTVDHASGVCPAIVEAGDRNPKPKTLNPKPLNPKP